MDRDWGSKTGGGGVMSASDANADRRERLRQLALQTIDLAKDPYFMKNHLGQYECRLCLTLHTNEGSYLAHTQGKRHQTNLNIRAIKEKEQQTKGPALKSGGVVKGVRKAPRIGRPGYRVTKLFDRDTRQKALLFQIEYPEIDKNIQPRHRFMSSFEQRIEEPDKNYQYLIFAADPYETISFKIPNLEVDKAEGKFFSDWDRDNLIFTLQIYFKEKIIPQDPQQQQQQQQQQILQPPQQQQQPVPMHPHAHLHTGIPAPR